MSALKFAKQAFGTEKPHSSISDWVEILTKNDVTEEAYDGIPELVDAINLQATSGPAEASRALRKKLKHGNAHQQYRALALYILKALVDNCGEKFRSIFQDGHLTDALKNIATDVDANRRVKKKLQLVLRSWEEQYKDDPNMHFVASILKYNVRGKPLSPPGDVLLGLVTLEEKKTKEKEEKRKPNSKEGKTKKGQQQKRVPFNFEKDKPKVMQSIVEGSQASSNLVNAITLVNQKTDNLQTNERVQECLDQAKKARTTVVRYIQLVENEEVIGTLIETNDRLMSAIEMYGQLLASGVDQDPESTAVTKAMDAIYIQPPPPSFDNEEVKNEISGPRLHPDLADLSFGPLGSLSSGLQPPLRPSHLSDDDDDQPEQRRASLSDFSDFESSDEETHKAHAGPSRRNYVTVSDDEEYSTLPPGSESNHVGEDPFADPFADVPPRR